MGPTQIRTSAESEAAKLLIHYMGEAGIEITSDVDAELRKLVRLIINAAVAQGSIDRHVPPAMCSHPSVDDAYCNLCGTRVLN